MMPWNSPNMMGMSMSLARDSVAYTNVFEMVTANASAESATPNTMISTRVKASSSRDAQRAKRRYDIPSAHSKRR